MSTTTSKFSHAQISSDDKAGQERKQKKNLCSSIFRLFYPNQHIEKDIDSVTTCDSFASSETSSPQKPNFSVKNLSIKDEISKSRQKISFMSNYTLIEGLKTSYIRDNMTTNKADAQRTPFPVRSYSGHSKRGQSVSDPHKKNQDALLMIEHTESKSLIFACLDGHGVTGEAVAQFVKGYLEQSLCSHPLFIENLQEAIRQTIAESEKELFENSDIDCDSSGTTLVIAVIRGNRVTVGNVGDSRVLLISQEGKGKFDGKPLSYDHKPEDKEEKERILRVGGRVLSVTYPDGTVGPARVWRGDVDAPGLAMSRSIGDRLVHNWGVISNPDFIEHEFERIEDVALVVASDGLWNVLSDNEVIKYVMSSREPSGAVGLLLRESHNRWVRAGAESVDDTTIAVAFLSH